MLDILPLKSASLSGYICGTRMLTMEQESWRRLTKTNCCEEVRGSCGMVMEEEAETYVTPST